MLVFHVTCFWSWFFVEFTKTQKYDAKSYLCKVPYASSFLKLREKVRMKVRTFRTFCHFFETCVAFVLFDYGKKRRLSKPCSKQDVFIEFVWEKGLNSSDSYTKYNVLTIYQFWNQQYSQIINDNKCKFSISSLADRFR